MSDRYFEDFAVGDRFKTRGVTLTESMIVDFALRHDPQPLNRERTIMRMTRFIRGLLVTGAIVTNAGRYRTRCQSVVPGARRVRTTSAMIPTMNSTRLIACETVSPATLRALSPRKASTLNRTSPYSTR